LAETVQVNFESRMLTDGKLVDGEAGGGFSQYTEVKSVAYPAI